jgi:trigger factor
MNEACKREVSIEIPSAEVAKETAALVKKYQKLARVPGFRPGKTPATVILKRFGEELKSEVLEAMVPRFTREQIEAAKLEPVSQPMITDLHMHDGEPIRFKAVFEIMPEYDVKDYTGAKIEKKESKVTDKEVEEALEHLRQGQATFSNIEEERGLKDGDFAQVAFSGRPKDDPEGQEVKVEAVLLEIAGENTLPEFNENLRGVKVGEEKTFDVAYPADFADKRLSGKTFGYTVKVNGIKQRTIPELSDDFAKELGEEFPTLAELKKKIRENMEAEKKHSVEHEAKDKLVEALVKANDFPVPESLVERQIDTRLERGLRALAAQGMNAEAMRNMDFNRLRAGQREAALREVKAGLILEKVADKEKIEISDEEFDKELESLAKQTQQTAEALRARLTRDGGLDRIRNRMRSEKTLEFLYSKSA